MMHLEGSLLSAQIIAQLETLPGQRDADFDLPKGERLADTIVRAWSEARSLYQVFKSRMERVRENESGASDTRRFWLEPLMALLGYDPLLQQQGEVIENHTYFISHRDSKAGIPIHLTGFKQDPDKRRPGVDRLSPQALVQEFLNRKETFLYGLLSNGLLIRLLRDNARLKQQQYAEWNLQQIFEEDRYPEFAQLYRILHASRLRAENNNPTQCLLEIWHQKGVEEGNRVRDGLRDAVMEALKLLGNGFLQHRDNLALRQAIAENRLSPEEYNRQLRRLIYRLLFLMVAEERELIFAEAGAATAEQRRIRSIYREHYSLNRFREMAELRRRCEGQAQNVWRELLVTFGIFESETLGQPFGITPLDGELFHPEALEALKTAELSNQVLLEALHQLHTYEDPLFKTRRRINYRSLDVEELGSVYESLLDLHPLIQTDLAGTMAFSYVQATERKTTGSYYTRHDLVAELLQSTLEPVMQERIRQAGEDPGQRAAALLELKVCDPSCGSGHFLLAAARRIAFELAQVRTSGDQPTASEVRSSLREVIEHCIYGVDLNPDAIELCQVALWLESHYPGRPLSFLQHKIRCGNSLVGVHDLQLLKNGLPDEAFKEVTGDDKETAKLLRKQNKHWREKQQHTLFGQNDIPTQQATEELGEAFRLFDALDNHTVQGRQLKARTWKQLRQDKSWLRPLTGCHLFTAAFFQPLRPDKRHISAELLHMQQKTVLGASADAQLEGHAYGLAEQYRFFHWPLEFPDVFAQEGFDVMLGNPPWERIKLQQQEFFATRDADIANAANKAMRERLIQQSAQTKPELFQQYQNALHEAEATGKFLRNSGRYLLTAVGDINTYSVFSELFNQLVRPEGRVGFIVPTGIATDDSNKAFFGAMVEQNRLVSLFDFENREAIFPGVHRSYKFSLLTLSGTSRGAEPARFGFFLTRTAHLQDEQRIFTLNSDDFLRLNPNTRTCPVFRTRVDAELTAAIYRRMPILLNETTGENPWGIKFMRMFDMSNDSHLFRTRPQLEAEGFVLRGNRFVRGEEVWLPLYEAKMIWHYDHRFGTYEGVESRTSTSMSTFNQYTDKCYQLIPWYWVSQSERNKKSTSKWLLGWRDITNSTNERTMVSSLTPEVGTGDTLLLMFPSCSSSEIGILLSMLNSIPFDFIVRQKIGGIHLKYHVTKQLPLLAREIITSKIKTLLPLLLELTYTSWDIKAFADDIWRESDEALRSALVRQWEENREVTGGHDWVLPEWADAYPEISWEREGDGCPLPPFRWDEERRARLRARLDAHYARLYGLSYDELRYILDPQDVYGPDFPGETFRVLKDKEMRMYGEYRTRRLVLEAWGEDPIAYQ